MKELDINKEYNNGGSLYLEDGYLYKVYDEISYLNKNIDFMDKVSAIKDIISPKILYIVMEYVSRDIYLSNFLYLIVFLYSIPLLQPIIF